MHSLNHAKSGSSKSTNMSQIEKSICLGMVHLSNVFTESDFSRHCLRHCKYNLRRTSKVYGAYILVKEDGK
jgi:hypothetical protein